MKILLVEDDPKTVAYLQKGLTEHGFVVDVCEDGDKGLYQALATDYSLLILDVMLPGRDGWALLSELRRMLRRVPARHSDVLSIADLSIDVRRHRVTRGGRAVDLTPKEFLLLSLLAEREGEVLSRTLIAEQVWDMNFDSDTNVADVHIRRLRAKVDDPFERKLIHTVRGLGYVLR